LRTDWNAEPRLNLWGILFMSPAVEFPGMDLVISAFADKLLRSWQFMRPGPVICVAGLSALGDGPARIRDLIAMRELDHRLASGKVMARGDVTGAPTLSEPLFDHPQGHTETLGNLSPRAFVVVVGIEDPLAKIQGERAHEPTGTTATPTWLHYLLNCSMS